MDALLASPETLETALGLPTHCWKGKKVVRIDVPCPQNLRIPSGNESGANAQWIPAGKTPTGYDEAVIDPIPAGGYLETAL